jgi:large subunit ribosomal protein L17
MRHNVRGRKLGRTSSHRKAMFRNQICSLVDKERIRTTLDKAKELRPVAEKIVTQGKRGTVHARRQVRQWIDDRALIKKLFDEIAPRFAERPGGYLRIVKLGPRLGDNAEMALLEFVEGPEAHAAPSDEKPAKAAKKKATKKKAASRKKKAAPEAEVAAE